jgi:hypothetical protein
MSCGSPYGYHADIVGDKKAEMEKVVRVFDSFEEADAADAEENRTMTPERRLAMVFELRERLYPDASQQGLARVVELLNSTGVEYLVVGVFAVAWHGNARCTADIDFLIRPELSNAELVVKALRDFGFASLGISPADLKHPDRIVQLGVKPNRIDLITRIAGVTLEKARQAALPER